MTAGALLGELRRRGVVLWGEGERLRWRAPRGVFTDVDRVILSARKDELLTALAAEGVIVVPDTACGFCGTTSWAWTPDWPISGAGAWLCATCCYRSAPTLVEVAAAITENEKRALQAEAEAGDALAKAVLLDLTPREDLTDPENAAAWLLYSRRLGREVWLLRDKAASALLSAADMDGRVVVLADELMHLTGLDNSTLQTVLDVKVMLNAEIVGGAPDAAEGRG